MWTEIPDVQAVFKKAAELEITEWLNWTELKMIEVLSIICLLWLNLII